MQNQNNSMLLRQPRPMSRYFATILTRKSLGGLLLCGLYRGTGGIGVGKHIPGLDYAWLPYFSHPGNRNEYRPKILNWFKYWRHPLSEDMPGDLEQAISQVNINLNFSDDTISTTVHPESYVHNLRILTQLAQRLDVSGVLIMSPSFIEGAVNEIEETKANDNDLLFNRDTHWVSVESGRLGLHLARTGNINLACCNHPRYSVPYSHIVRSSHAMDRWLGEIVRSYRLKQLKLSTAKSCTVGRMHAAEGSRLSSY